MSILSRLADALGGNTGWKESDRQAEYDHYDGYYAGQGTGSNPASWNNGGGNYHEYNQNGITDAQQHALELWLIHGVKEGAHLANANRNTFDKVVDDAKERLGLVGMTRTEAYVWFCNNIGYEPAERNDTFDYVRYACERMEHGEGGFRDENDNSSTDTPDYW